MSKDLHPVFEVYDGLFNSASGQLVNLINPKADTINLYDIAKGLSNICRFGGQVERFHSVAKHTLLVWYLTPEKYKKAALLHDAPEAYLGDVIKPLKVLIEKEYGPFEDLFTQVIFEKYGVDVADLEHIKKYDLAALEIEHAYLRNGDRRFFNLFKFINELLTNGSPFVQLHELLVKEFGSYE